MPSHTFPFFCLFLGSVGLVVGDEAAEQQQVQQLQAIFQQSAEEYEFKLVNADAKLELRQQSVMQWVNPARVQTASMQHGSVYVWTLNGRAEVLGTIFSQTVAGEDPDLYHEMHSLSPDIVRAERDGTLFWQPAEPGISRKAFTRAPRPADNARLRMVQMRSLARRFSGYSINYDDARWDLRLLPEPLYRMPQPNAELLSSAIFALVSTAGTDPEILLVIEATKNDGRPKWEYAVCRFTDLKTWISLDGNEVWSFTNGTQGATTDAGPTEKYRFSIEGSRTLSTPLSPNS